MSETYDFNDGNGPVLAHRHSNGGGWVANTATVADSAYVGPNALVYGKAQVCDTAQVYGNAMVYGHACVYGNALVYGNAEVCGSALVYGNAPQTSSDNHDEIIDAQAKRIAELEEAIRVLADTVVVFWTSADFVRHSDSLTHARKNPIVCRAIDEARGATK